MEHPQITIALLGCPAAGTHAIFKALNGSRPYHRECSLVNSSFIYAGHEFRTAAASPPHVLGSSDRENAGIKQYVRSGLADIVVLVCDGSYLEPGLHLLKELVGTDSIKEKSVPVILCVNHCQRAKRHGIQIDFELLEDVLQIPVLPCSIWDKESIDDLKAAICYASHSSGRPMFHYECLDFVPGRLANESICYCWAGNGPAMAVLQYLSSRPATGVLMALLLLLTVTWLAAADALLPPGVFLIQKLLKLLGGFGACIQISLAHAAPKLLDTCLHLLSLHA